jgi:rod shape-determining protein MreC
MARWHESSVRTTSSTKLLIQRGLVVVLVITALTLTALSRAQHDGLGKARARVLDQLTPALNLMARPVEAWHQFQSSVSGVFHVYEENRRLENENDTLRHWQSVAMSLKAENESLRTLMQYQPVEGATYVSAKVTGHIGSAFSHQILINAGKNEGVSKYQAVVDAYGLVGRILRAGDHSSRVLLISDVNSRIPVVASESRERAILMGTAGEMMRLAFLSPQSKTKVGDVIVTTEDGGLMPPDIMIGKVFSIQDGTYMVKPLRPVNASEFIRVVHHKSH